MLSAELLILLHERSLYHLKHSEGGFEDETKVRKHCFKLKDREGSGKSIMLQSHSPEFKELVLRQLGCCQTSFAFLVC